MDSLTNTLSLSTNPRSTKTVGTDIDSLVVKELTSSWEALATTNAVISKLEALPRQKVAVSYVDALLSSAPLFNVEAGLQLLTSHRLQSDMFQHIRNYFSHRNYFPDLHTTIDISSALSETIVSSGLLSQYADHAAKIMQDLAHDLFTNHISNSDKMLSELREVIQDSEEDEDSALTDHATQTFTELLLHTDRLMSPSFPYGSLSVDGEGGLRIEWDKKDRKVRIAIPSSLEGPYYLYYENQEQYGVKRPVTSTLLVHWLNWLADA